MRLKDNVSSLKGVGEKTATLLQKLNISSIADLLYDLPRGFMDIKEPTEPDKEHVGGLISVSGSIVKGSVHIIKKGRTMTFAKVRTQNETVQIVYFNAPYMKKTLESIDGERVFYGILSDSRGYMIAQPAVFDPDEYVHMLKVMQPVYSLTKGLSNKQLKKLIRAAFDVIELPDEYLSEDELREYNMPPIKDALIGLHFPTDMAQHSSARKRIAFHEFLTFFLEMSPDKNVVETKFDGLMMETADAPRLIEALPYKLTDSQLKVWKEIETDMCSGICMNRMVQGDVGSGKTIVAILALLLNAANSHQGCMMAPTEVLATQHYENIVKLTEKYGLCIKPVLLIGSVTGNAKKQVQERIKNGEVNVIIGTQALITDNAVYRDLTLVITDEQHRFGVKQREALAGKGKATHVLVMSATPIPRSLALTMYAGVRLSVIDKLPEGRLPIKNCVVGKSSRQASYKFIIDEVKKGRQAYVICPMIDASEGMDIENVTDYTARLKEILPNDIRIDFLHGRMKLNEKKRIMDEFAAHNIDVLVSTTVIEVGIDVPNATVMMIENADRYGLAALHQIRGRVGRGKDQSYCIFVNSSSTEDASARLKIVGESNDGFHIAEEDLRLRGPGEFTGIRQSGEFGFKVASIYDDANVLSAAREYSDMLLLTDNTERLREISESIENFGFTAVDFKSI